MKKKSNSSLTIYVSEICEQILKHKDCPGITAEQVKALIQGKTASSAPEIVNAVRETDYYRQYGNIDIATLLTIPQNSWQPIHHLIAKFS